VALSARAPYHVVGARYMATLAIAHDDPLLPEHIAVPLAMVVAAPCRCTAYLPAIEKAPGR
jgi:hypothetical protein